LTRLLAVDLTMSNPKAPVARPFEARMARVPDASVAARCVRKPPVRRTTVAQRWGSGHGFARRGAGAVLASCALAGCVPSELELKPEATTSVTSSSAAGGGGSMGAGGSGPLVVPPEVAAWLDGQKGGFCNTTPNAHVNLCGDVVYCKDTTFLKAYPDGLSIDIGFYWGGQNGGDLLSLGAQVPDDQRIMIGLAIDGTVTAQGPNQGEALSYRIDFGPHLLSYRVSVGRRALFIDGALVGYSTKGTGAIALSPGPAGDPGAVLGHAATNQMQGGSAAAWLRFAPFFFHLRAGVESFEASSLPEATELDAARSVRLFGQESKGATTWTAQVSGTPAAVVKLAAWVEDVDASCL